MSFEPGQKVRVIKFMDHSQIRYPDEKVVFTVATPEQLVESGVVDSEYDIVIENMRKTHGVRIDRSEVIPLILNDPDPMDCGFMFHGAVAALNYSIIWAPSVCIQRAKPDCPKCEQRWVIPPDYLCESCRFGV